MDNPSKNLVRNFFVWHQNQSQNSAQAIVVETKKLSHYTDYFTIDVIFNSNSYIIKGFAYRIRHQCCFPLEILDTQEQSIRFSVHPCDSGDQLLFLICAVPKVGKVNHAISQDAIRIDVLARFR